MAWTPDLVKLFEELKVRIASFPVLSMLDYQMRTFSRTNWSAEGVVWIPMQPANDIESTTATEHLLKTG